MLHTLTDIVDFNFSCVLYFSMSVIICYKFKTRLCGLCAMGACRRRVGERAHTLQNSGVTRCPARLGVKHFSITQLYCGSFSGVLMVKTWLNW